MPTRHEKLWIFKIQGFFSPQTHVELIKYRTEQQIASLVAILVATNVRRFEGHQAPPESDQVARSLLSG